jgi:signal transduction histidine kinase
MEVGEKRNELFPYLDTSALAALGLLRIPIYIYSFATQRLIWANPPAVQFWHAKSLDELHERVLTPYSKVTISRLEDFLSSFRRGETRSESWVFYPKDLAAPALVHCRGICVAGHPEAMLVELQPRDYERSPIDDIRALEFLRHTPTGVSLLSLDGEVLLQNVAAKEFFEQQETQGLNGLEALRRLFAYPDDFQVLLDEAEKFGVAERTVPIVQQRGTFHSIQLKRISDPGSGDPVILVIQHDISRLQDVRSQLAASEAALDVVLGLSAVPSLLISPTGHAVLKSNFAAEKLFGFENSDLADPLHYFPGSEMLGFIETVMLTGSCSRSMLLTNQTGRNFQAAISGTRLDYAKNDAILLIIQDIDEDRQLAIELETALDYQRGITELNRSLLEIATHEFRTPLAIIDGAAQRILRRADQFTPEMLMESAGRIRSFVARLSSLLDSTIERARTEMAGVPCARSPGFIHQAIDEVASSFSDSAHIEITEGVRSLPEAWFDHPQVERALINLMENAVKYSNGDARIRISGAVEDDQVVLHFRDWGIGIPADQQDLVFSERVRGANVGARPGNGLGLYIVRVIFRAHGGDASVVDTSGPGTTIRLTLPLRQGAEQTYDWS